MIDRSTAARGRAGFTLIEVLVALLLGSLIGVLALGTLARQRTLQADLSRRGDVLAALRAARHVLGREIRRGDGSPVVAPDSLAVRAYRGVGLVCPGGGAQELLVRTSGVRAPDPGKDSVRILSLDGSERVLALVERETGVPCPEAPAARFERWRLSGPAPGEAVLARWFETGSYHLSGRALRYRRGAAGRQPLTPEALGTPPGSFRIRGQTLLAELVVPGGHAVVLSLGRVFVPAG